MFDMHIPRSRPVCAPQICRQPQGPEEADASRPARRRTPRRLRTAAAAGAGSHPLPSRPAKAAAPAFPKAARPAEALAAGLAFQHFSSSSSAYGYSSDSRWTRRQKRPVVGAGSRFPLRRIAVFASGVRAWGLPRRPSAAGLAFALRLTPAPGACPVFGRFWASLPGGTRVYACRTYVRRI